MATGSGHMSIDFDRPTADELRLFRAIVGPGGLRVSGLGYASPDLLSLSAGGGEFEIDLSGPWDKDGIVKIDVIGVAPGSTVPARRSSPYPRFGRRANRHLLKSYRSKGLPVG